MKRPEQRPSVRAHVNRHPVVRVRRARATDIGILTAIEVGCFRSYYRPHRLDEDDFTRYLRKRNTIAFVAHTGTKVVGYILGVAPLMGHPSSGRLDSIAVLPAWRDRDIGHRLLTAFIRTSRQRGCTYVSLEVAAPNRSARQLFSHAAFKPRRRLPKYYNGTTDAVRLRAVLSR